jgi:hypothetical protein
MMRMNKITAVEENQEKKRLFLEITAQVCRLSGVKEKKESVTKKMKQYFENSAESNWRDKLITSTVVYAEFLSTTVRDILLVRDLVKERFLDNNKYDLKLHEVGESLSGYPKTWGDTRAARILIIIAALIRRFRGFESIETRRVIRFLDTTARNLAFNDFFLIRIDGQRIKIEENSPSYLKEIGCLTKDPLQEDCNTKNGYECRHKIYVPDVKKNGHGDKCLVANSPITKCKEEPRENCNIERFFGKKGIKKNLELLKKAVEEKKFSLKFRNKRKNKKWLACFKEWDFTKNEFAFRGQNCWRPFFDMIILLQCPADAAILSSDKDFDELGKAIGRDTIRVSF